MQSAMAGVIAGCITRSCTSPMDVVKIVIQVNGNNLAAQTQCRYNSVLLQACANPLVNRTPSLWQTVSLLHAQEGIKCFWKGNVVGCCRLGPYTGAKFFLFESLVHQVSQRNVTPTPIQLAMCGSLAGIAATLLTYPLEVVRTKLITQSTAKNQLAVKTTPYIRGLTHGLRVIYQYEGIRGLYKGGGSGIIGAIPFEGIQFGCYEFLKSRVSKYRFPAFRWSEEKTQLDTLDFFVCGSIAGAVAQTAAYPFDTVKKRLQTSAAAQGNPQYHGMIDCFHKVIKNEGVLALYRGTIPNMIRILPYAALMFSTYEISKKGIKSLMDD
jgi:solute carrier family 25 protein 43